VDGESEISGETGRGARTAVLHGAWFAACALAAGVCVIGSAEARLTSALCLIAIPGAAGAFLRGRPATGPRVAVLGLWALTAAAAVLLSGGLAGPLTAWTLMPLAASTMLVDRRRVASGAVLTAIVAAVVGLARAAGLATETGESHPWLAFFAMTTAAAAFGAAIATEQSRTIGVRDALGQARRRAALFLEAQPLLILRLAPDGAVLETFGPIFEPLTQQLLDGGFRSLAAGGALQAALEEAFDEGRSEVGFAPAAAADGWISAVIFREGSGLVAALRDDSREHAREAGLEQAALDAESLNAGKSRFLANMSHELRTPLNAVVGFSDIMKSQMFGPLSEKYAEYAALIHESGGHLLDLINDVLDLSKIEAQRYELSREPFDAREAVSAALRLVRVQADVAGVRLRGALPPAPTRVDADRRALKQIILNLLSNALKFTPAGGSVEVALRTDGDDLVIVVADTGVGISAADLERLGKPYEQAGGADHKAMGTGLGLSLVRAFSELHGGSMTISSLLGEGARVTVRMPVVLPARRAETAPARSASAMGDPARSASAMGDNVIAFNPHR